MAIQGRPRVTQPAVSTGQQVRNCVEASPGRFHQGRRASARHCRPDVCVQSSPASQRVATAWQTGASMYVETL